MPDPTSEGIARREHVKASAQSVRSTPDYRGSVTSETVRDEGSSQKMPTQLDGALKLLTALGR